MRERWKNWLWAPIAIPRSTLFVKYLIFIYFGAVSAIVGVPVFNLNAPTGYAVIWGVCMVLAGIGGSIGVTRDSWWKLEMWSVLCLFGLSFAYVSSLTTIAYASHDPGRQALAAGITLILVLPLTRFLDLLRLGGSTKKATQK